MCQWESTKSLKSLACLYSSESTRMVCPTWDWAKSRNEGAVTALHPFNPSLFCCAHKACYQPNLQAFLDGQIPAQASSFLQLWNEFLTFPQEQFHLSVFHRIHAFEDYFNSSLLLMIELLIPPSFVLSASFISNWSLSLCTSFIKMSSRMGPGEPCGAPGEDWLGNPTELLICRLCMIDLLSLTVTSLLVFNHKISAYIMLHSEKPQRMRQDLNVTSDTVTLWGSVS